MERVPVVPEANGPIPAARWRGQASLGPPTLHGVLTEALVGDVVVHEPGLQRELLLQESVVRTRLLDRDPEAFRRRIGDRIRPKCASRSPAPTNASSAA